MPFGFMDWSLDESIKLCYAYIIGVIPLCAWYLHA